MPYVKAPRKTCERKQFGTVAIQHVMKERLELISGEEPLVLDSDDGQETLFQATDAFRYIDSNFKHSRCDVAAPATNKMAVQVYEMVRDSTFEELFGGFGVPLDALTLTQSQIKRSSNSLNIIVTG
jgi:hypothetical protein